MCWIYSDGQQKQENQIKAIRSFIAKKVDVIVFTAIVETGLRPRPQEAKRAGIPVIMIDRDVQKADRDLRLTIMGSDFVKEGEKAALWLADYLKKNGKDDGQKQINIVELQGTTGSAPAIDRKTGFANIMKDHPNWKITRSQTGNFTTSEGKAVMEAFLKADKNIDVLYAHNDGMALGAIQAIKEAGLQPGKDIIVIGVDAREGRLRSDGRRRAERLRGVQPVARAPGCPGHPRPQGREEASRQDLDHRKRLRPDQCSRGSADPPVLELSCRNHDVFKATRSGGLDFPSNGSMMTIEEGRACLTATRFSK